MNFNIIEGDYSLYDKAESFVEYYNNWNISVKEIQKRLDLNPYKYERLRQYCFENGLLTVLRNGGHQNPQYYYWNKNHKMFEVKKSNHYYASFKTSAEAERFVAFMKQYNWDKSKVEHVKTLMREKSKKKDVNGGVDFL